MPAMRRNANGNVAAFEPLWAGVDERVNAILARFDSLGQRVSEVAQRAIEEISEESWAHFQNGAVIPGGATGVVVPMGPPVAGTAWLVKWYAVSGGDGDYAVYYDQVAPGNLIDANAMVNRFAKHGIEVYVPQNRRLIFDFTNMAAADACSVSIGAQVMTQRGDVRAAYSGDEATPSAAGLLPRADNTAGD